MHRFMVYCFKTKSRRRFDISFLCTYIYTVSHYKETTKISRKVRDGKNFEDKSCRVSRGASNSDLELYIDLQGHFKVKSIILNGTRYI